MWEAQYVIVISSRTGWKESFIRWELPLSRGMAYYHAAMLLDGVPMRWPSERVKGEEEFNAMKQRVRAREAQRKGLISTRA